MALDFDLSLLKAPQVADPIDSVMALFQKGSALVDRAVVALRAIVPLVTSRMVAETVEQRRALVDAIFAEIHRAAIEGDNLLVSRSRSDERPFIVFALARQPDGTLAVQSIEIDRKAIVMTRTTDGGSALPYDRVRAALAFGDDETDPKVANEYQAALNGLAIHVSAARSRLSIVKARLDLQSSFLTAVVDAEAAVSGPRLDSPMNLADARAMALATGRLLSRQALNIGNSNRKTLQALFERHTSPPKNR